ncbi:hypothetical protein POPTR_003G155900v4 [Populus trichocarpa]|uniref:Uncharacterized protein n=2 Tax=Populus trichocarpa TaxID=3694 RepID=A0ACC0T9M2_POPTR|nr:hypothetical protein BDE02_03G140600 [Populus trichocarpa]KAI9398257.1 hypothetical protein POPTR_003G155900v4 [Populus trichocarpa]
MLQKVNFDSSSAIGRMLFKAASFNCTIWTADCNPNSSQAVIGTNLGAALVNLETGMASWVCRSKSDVLSQQLDPSGNVVLCGLINGAILTVDVREKQERVPDRLIRHRIPYSSLGRQGPSSSKQWFEVKGNMYSSRTIFMPSSICCMVSLQSDDQYFLASSMDGLASIGS